MLRYVTAFSLVNLSIWIELEEKGKPSVKMGRKATGLLERGQGIGASIL